jgi:hypothetical protein
MLIKTFYYNYIPKYKLNKYMCHEGHELYQNTQNANYHQSVTYDCHDVIQS